MAWDRNSNRCRRSRWINWKTRKVEASFSQKFLRTFKLLYQYLSSSLQIFFILFSRSVNLSRTSDGNLLSGLIMKLKFGCFTRIMFIASPNEYLLNVSKIEISLSRFSEPRLLDKKLTKDVKLDDTTLSKRVLSRSLRSFRYRATSSSCSILLSITLNLDV